MSFLFLFIFFYYSFFLPLLVMYPTVVSASLRLLSNTYPPFPPFCLSAPPEGDRPSSIPESFRDSPILIKVYFWWIGVQWILWGRREYLNFPPPSEPLFPHPWSTTSTGNSRHPFSGAVVPRDVGENATLQIHVKMAPSSWVIGSEKSLPATSKSVARVGALRNPWTMLSHCCRDLWISDSLAEMARMS